MDWQKTLYPGDIKIENKSESKALQPVQCPYCGVVHPAEARFCVECGTELSIGAAMEIKTIKIVEKKKFYNMTPEMQSIC
jgi:hypothetical protein